MSFDDEYMLGYTAHTKHFDKMAEKAYPLMGNIVQCSIFEFDDTGHAFLATNRPDYGEHFIEKKIYKTHNKITFGNAVDKELTPFLSNNCVQLMLDIASTTEHDFSTMMKNGFHYIEKLDNSNSFRLYGFHSDSGKIYNSLINDLDGIKKFIEFFAEESQNVIDYYKDKKFDLASQRDDYFDKNIQHPMSKKYKLLQLLKQLGKIDGNADISNIEWQCFESYSYGKTAKQTAQFLGISTKTVENHFDNLKNKLIHAKSEVIDYLS
jgi:hypothetical protein